MTLSSSNLNSSTLNHDRITTHEVQHGTQAINSSINVRLQVLLMTYSDSNNTNSDI